MAILRRAGLLSRIQPIKLQAYRAGLGLVNGRGRGCGRPRGAASAAATHRHTDDRADHAPQRDPSPNLHCPHAAQRGAGRANATIHQHPLGKPLRHSWLVTCLIGLIGLLAVGCQAATPPADQPQSDAPAPTTAPDTNAHGASRVVPWGLYQILWHRAQFTDQLDQALTTLAPAGTAPRWVLFFRDLGANRGFPLGAVEAAHARGLTPIISLELTIWGRGGDYLQAINDGQYDDWFRAWGTGAAAWGRPVLMRFGFEMNGDWFGWGQRPEAFVAAWRRAHRLISDTGADQVQWLWSPNVLYGEQTLETGFTPYYPGPAYVDLVGLDGYNFGDHHSQWHSWQSYGDVFGPSIDAITTFPHPLLISEIGCADDPRKAAWLADALTAIEADPRITGLVWFNLDKRSEGEADWRLDSDPETLAVWRDWLQRNQGQPASP